MLIFKFLLRRKLLRDMFHRFIVTTGVHLAQTMLLNRTGTIYWKIIESFSSLMYLSLCKYIPHLTLKKMKKEPVMYNDGKDKMVQYEEDTLFTTIPSKMEVEEELQEFHKTATFFPKRKG